MEGGHQLTAGRSNQTQLRHVTAGFLADLADWELFLTLTFSADVSLDRGYGAFKDYLQGIATERECQHYHLVWAGGRQRCGRLHFHAMVARLDQERFKLSQSEFKQLWRWGDCRVEAVRDQMAAAQYLLKHDFWHVVMVCDRTRPCRRKHGCRYGPTWPSPREVATA